MVYKFMPAIYGDLGGGDFLFYIAVWYIRYVSILCRRFDTALEMSI